MKGITKEVLMKQWALLRTITAYPGPLSWQHMTSRKSFAWRGVSIANMNPKWIPSGRNGDTYVI